MRSSLVTTAVLSAIGVSVVFAISFVDRGEASADSIPSIETMKADYQRPLTIPMPGDKATFSKRAAL